MPEFTILMPCLNEDATISACITKARRAITRLSLDAEILIADNGSRDKSVEIARSLGARVVDVAEKGYGNALLAGIRYAHGTYVIMADADDSYDFSDLDPFVQKLREGYDLVVGNRFKGGIEANAMPWLHRYLGNPILSFIGRLFFRINLGDFHCGYRGFLRQAMLASGLTAPGMEFASEMIVKTALHRFRITEVSTKLYPDGRSRPPHLRTWRDGWRHLRFLLLYSPRWLFLYPGLLLAITGLIFSSILIAGPLRLGTVTFDVHALLFAAVAVILGLQCALFYCSIQVIKAIMGLAEKNNWPSIARRFFSMEKGIVWGGALIIPGGALSLYSVYAWSESGYGDLSPTIMLRHVIPAVSLIMAGVQVIFHCFFISTLLLKCSARKGGGS